MRFQKSPLFAESWNVAYRQKSAGAILEDRNAPFTVIPNGFRYWAADPFVIERDGKVYIFAELYDYILRRGVLGYCAMTDGKAGKWTPVIQEPYHLSYPCILEHDSNVYIMPESGAGSCLTVYEAAVFPDQWRKVQVLRGNVKFADTTPIPCEGKHLALTHCVDDPQNPRLMLIDLDQKLADAAVEGAESFRSRPAGHMFQKNGKWIRPAQHSEDCGSGYGKALVFYECSISEDGQYDEAEIGTVFPRELKLDRPVFLDGMHTYNAGKQVEVIDIKTRRFNLLNFVMRVAGKFLR